MTSSNSNEPQNSPNKKELDLSIFNARVDRILIKGLVRTKDDYVPHAVKNLFQSKTFQDVLLEVNRARNNLAELGIFSNSRVLIDVSKGKDATPNGLEITFEGVELSRVTGQIGTEIGNNEGGLSVELATPNIFGRGERVGINGSYSTGKTNDVNLIFWKPFYHTMFGSIKPATSLKFFKHTAYFPWSKYRTNNIGFISELNFKLPSDIKHSLQYELSIREISAIGNKGIPFFVRKQNGPKLASIVRHQMSWDRRDSEIFPTTGFFLKTTNEISGLGGNVNYLMNNTHAEVNFPLFSGISIQICTRVGAIKSEEVNKIPISNLFILGGPLSVRGFKQAGIGPHQEGCAEGASTYWSTGLHLWAPLPFSYYFGGIGSLFRTHLFYNFGNTNSFTTENMRSAYGLGLAFKLGNRARIEFNYCYPFLRTNTDHVEKGFQFGIGYEFL